MSTYLLPGLGDLRVHIIVRDGARDQNLLLLETDIVGRDTWAQSANMN